MIAFTGCSDPECKTDSDCTKSCFTSICVDKKCQHNPQTNCCGNMMCESGESKCTCAVDCGPCPGITSSYLMPYCDAENDCASVANPSMIQEKGKSIELTLSSQSKLGVEFNYDQPFDVDESLFKAIFQMNSKTDMNINVKISSIEVFEVSPMGERSTIVKAIVDKKLYDISSEILEKIPLDINFDSETDKTISVIVNYEETIKYGAGEQTSQQSYTENLGLIKFINPSKKKACPASCDDGNECTDDLCGADTSYYCNYRVKPGKCCGNYACESGENQCNCQTDCGTCSETIGNYMEKECVSNQCVSFIKRDVEIKPTTKLQEIQGVYNIQSKLSFNEPFDIGSDQFIINFELVSKGSELGNLDCTKIQAIQGNDLLGERTIDERLNNAGDEFRVILSLDFTQLEVEKIMSPNIKVFCNYNQADTNQLITFTLSPGTMTFVRTGK
ncbi:MAG: hypothetical protein ABII01_06355 [Candidatus Woesearchaeota archaeon]